MRGLIQARLRRTATLPRQRSLTVVLAGVILAALLLPATALANHIFSDVPTGMTGHAAIEAIYDAGITGGCGGTRYCPTDAVTRAQMALFMQRGFPRVGYVSGSAGAAVGSGWGPLNALTIRTPGATAKRQMIDADAAANFQVTDAAGCPCDIEAAITVTGHSTNIVNVITVTEVGWYTMALTSALEVDTNSDIVVGVQARYVTSTVGTPAMTGFIDISSITAPFGCDCNSILAGEMPTLDGQRVVTAP